MNNENRKSVQEIVNQYRKNFRADLQQVRADLHQGKTNHLSLDKHLNDVMDQLQEEMRKEANELLAEVNENAEKKTAPAPDAEKKFGSTPKEPKSKY